MANSQSQPRIQLLHEAPFVRLTLMHGKQNVIDVQMMDELAQALASIESQNEISTIILSGAGEHFSAGVDIPSHASGKVEIMLPKFHEVARRLARTPKVTIASVRGNCLGGGAELALVCDIVITSDDAAWGFPEITLGCYPPVAAAVLAAIVGQKRAAELVLTGRTFSGGEAEQFGIANRAVADYQLEDTLQQYETWLKALSPAALTHAKRALYSWDAAHFEKGLTRAEEIYLEQLMRTADAQEGIRAWIETRKPQWKGK